MGQLPNEEIPLNRAGEQYRKLHPEEAQRREEETGKVRRSHGDLLIEMEIQTQKELKNGIPKLGENGRSNRETGTAQQEGEMR